MVFDVEQGTAYPLTAVVVTVKRLPFAVRFSPLTAGCNSLAFLLLPFWMKILLSNIQGNSKRLLILIGWIATLRHLVLDCSLVQQSSES